MTSKFQARFKCSLWAKGGSELRHLIASLTKLNGGQRLGPRNSTALLGLLHFSDLGGGVLAHKVQAEFKFL